MTLDTSISFDHIFHGPEDRDISPWSKWSSACSSPSIQVYHSPGGYAVCQSDGPCRAVAPARCPSIVSMDRSIGGAEGVGVHLEVLVAAIVAGQPIAFLCAIGPIRSQNEQPPLRRQEREVIQALLAQLGQLKALHAHHSALKSLEARPPPLVSPVTELHSATSLTQISSPMAGVISRCLEPGTKRFRLSGVALVPGST